MKMWRTIQICIILIACIVRGEMQIPSKVLEEFKVEIGYETILLMQNSTDCWEDLKVSFATPIINFNANQEFFLAKKFKKHFLALVCLESQEDSVLDALHANLDNMRATETLFMVNRDINIQALFENCFQQGMLNVLAISDGSPYHIYSYRAFPTFRIVKRAIGQVQRYFEPQLKDLAGHRLVTIADNIFPRTVIYKNAAGRNQLSGYLVPFIENFARKLNATLKTCWEDTPPDEEVLGWSKTTHLMNIGRVDIPAIIVNTAFSHTLLANSYVMEISKWQLMLPLESDINRALVIIGGGCWIHMAFTMTVMLLFALLLLNNERLERDLAPSARCLNLFSDSVLRAMLYQTFVMPLRITVRLKCVYTMIMLCGFLYYNVYIAQMETLLVNPMTKAPIRNYQDMRRTGLKVMLTDSDKYAMVSAIGKQQLLDNWDVHKLVNTSMFQAMRSQPNPNYAYPITQTLWPLIQRKFVKQRRSAFRLSNDFTFLSLVFFGIPLPRNSIYETVLNHYIHQTHASGLYSFWCRQSFHSLVAIGRTEELPYADETANLFLSWTDLFYSWVAYMFLIVISLVIFACELAVKPFKRWRRNKNKLRRQPWVP